jgi:hypothetical protein
MPAAAPINAIPDFAPPAAPPAPEPEEKPKIPSYLMWGIGGASLVVGTVFGIAALSSESDFNKNPTYSKADTVHKETIASDVGLGLGAVLLISGTVFYFVDDKDSTTGQAKQKSAPLASVAVEPMLGRQIRGGTVTLRF